MHKIEAYIRLAIIFIILISILYIPIIFILKRKGKSIVRSLSYLGLLCSLFLIVFATILFMPITFSPEVHILNIKPFTWMGSIQARETLITEKIPNILLFLPLGIFIPVVWKTKRDLKQVTLLAFFISFSIEFFQYFIGRFSDIDDIITNVLGAIIGYFIFKMCDSIFKGKKMWNKFLNRR